MSYFDWDFDEHLGRGTDVRRRLVIDHRNYEVTAFDDGSGVVGVRLVGWDSGYIFTELVAELPTGDASDVGHLLASALAGFRGGDPPRLPPPRDRPVQDPRPAAAKSGRPWAPADLDLLVRRFREGASIRTLTTELGRTDGAIRQRLQLLGETRPAPPQDEAPATAYPAAEDPTSSTPAMGSGAGPGALAELSSEGVG
jgi:hypothetical protein